MLIIPRHHKPGPAARPAEDRAENHLTMGRKKTHYGISLVDGRPRGRNARIIPRGHQATRCGEGGITYPTVGSQGPAAARPLPARRTEFYGQVKAESTSSSTAFGEGDDGATRRRGFSTRLAKYLERAARRPGSSE